MGEGIRIEEPSNADLAAIAALESRAFKSPWRRDFFGSEIGAEGRYNLVARDEEGRVVGYLFAMYFLDEMHVNKIAVSDELRRRGIARALMLSCIAFARQHDVHMISLEVRETNAGAQAFYRNLGFGPTYVRRRYYPDGEAAVVMTIRF